MPSPQILRDPSPPTTHLPAQNYQSSRQPTPDNRPSPMSDSNHSLITHSRSRSPAIQGQRKHFLASAAYAQHPASGRIQSQSPIIQPRSLELNPPKPMQQTFAMMVQSQPSVTDRYSAKVQLQAVHRERHETVQPASVLPQTSLINHKTSQLLDGKPFTNDTPYQAHSISHSQADPLQHKTSNPSPASPIQIKWLPVMSDRSPRMKLATVAVPHQSSQPSQTPPISQTFQQRSRSISKPITEQEIESVVKAEVKTKMNAKPAEEPSSPVSEIDYALLLIDLAEEFFDAAYGRSSEGRPGRREKDLNCFYKLIATGLGCLEVVLKQWRSALQPAVEAAVRLRYASVLFAETTNSIEAEEVLSKGISQCDKLRLMDLKYNMQHLLARVTFATNPKAAIKYVGAAIKDAEM